MTINRLLQRRLAIIISAGFNVNLKLSHFSFYPLWHKLTASATSEAVKITEKDDHPISTSPKCQCAAE